MGVDGELGRSAGGWARAPDQTVISSNPVGYQNHAAYLSDFVASSWIYTVNLAVKGSIPVVGQFRDNMEYQLSNGLRYLPVDGTK